MQTLILVALAAVLMHAGSASAQFACFAALSNLPFAENRSAAESAQTLRDELLFQRATQTHLWALPLINTLGMLASIGIAKGRGWKPGDIEKVP